MYRHPPLSYPCSLLLKEDDLWQGHGDAAFLQTTGELQSTVLWPIAPKAPVISLCPVWCLFCLTWFLTSLHINRWVLNKATPRSSLAWYNDRKRHIRTLFHCGYLFSLEPFNIFNPTQTTIGYILQNATNIAELVIVIKIVGFKFELLQWRQGADLAIWT